MLTLFLIGVVEMLIVTAWTHLVTRMHVIGSGAVTMLNVLIWYYVLQKVMSDLGNWQLAIFYALGCAFGTAGCTYFVQQTQKQRRKKALLQKPMTLAEEPTLL